MKAFWRPRVRTTRTPRPRIGVERLECRAVPAAAVAAYDPATVLVAYRTPGGTAPRAEAVPPGQTVEQTVAGWLTTPGVAYAQPNYLRATAAVPNDTRFGLQYAQHNTGQTVNGAVGVADADTDAAEAWDQWAGSPKAVVAVIDTGVDYTHRDLYQNVWINQGEIPAAVKAALTDVDRDGVITFWDLNAVVDGVKVNVGPGKVEDLNGNGYIDGRDLIGAVGALAGWEDGQDNDGNGYADDLVGWNFAAGTNDPIDTTADRGGHGTHVAGTIAAVGNNGTDVAGAVWKARVMALKFIVNNNGTDADGAAALRYAADNGAFASNNSWGGGGESPALQDAITYAQDKGMVTVVAAGNSGANNDTGNFYPARYSLPSFNLPSVVTVAATDNRDGLASFSNFGRTSVELAAPGVSVISTYPGNAVAYMSGTSMATPQVTGVFALVKSYYSSITAADAIGKVLAGVDPITSVATKTVTGGRLNAYNAVVDRAGAAVTALAPNAAGTAAVSAVRVTFSEPINPASFDAADVALTAPNGAAVTASGVAAVPGTENTQFDITFPAQSAAGKYAVAVGPDVRDRAGNPMDQNANGANGEAPADQYAGSFTIDAPATPAFGFVGSDAVTQGNWVGKYGAAGYSLAVGPSSLPAGVTVTPGPKNDYLFSRTSTDPRALQVPGAAGRLAAIWWSYGTLSVAVAPPAGEARRLSVYLADYGRNGRAERVDVFDTATGKLLDSRTVASYVDGVYLTWTVTGKVTLKFTKTAGPSPTASGFFLD
ncbi:MAG: S8 family serine peptidase [Gemmataceae bacterium]|nr:S8 family serine peptidase [Gemmataceae bacterium]